MYLFIPNAFLILVRYAEQGILNIRRIVRLQEYNSYSNLTNKTGKREEIVIGVSLPDQVVPRWYENEELWKNTLSLKELHWR